MLAVFVLALLVPAEWLRRGNRRLAFTSTLTVDLFFDAFLLAEEGETSLSILGDGDGRRTDGSGIGSSSSDRLERFDDRSGRGVWVGTGTLYMGRGAGSSMLTSPLGGVKCRCCATAKRLVWDETSSPERSRRWAARGDIGTCSTRLGRASRLACC